VRVFFLSWYRRCLQIAPRASFVRNVTTAAKKLIFGSDRSKRCKIDTFLKVLIENQNLALAYFESCCVVLCCVVLCCVVLCCVMLCYVVLCCVTLCYFVLFCVTLCYVMLCYVMLCYVMLCYVMLCYVMLCYVMSELILILHGSLSNKYYVSLQ
jgi:hypothetical protein